MMARPNIVLICADDIGFNEIGVYQGSGMPDRDVFGGARVHTPRIDAIAREGARFDRFYATSAICTIADPRHGAVVRDLKRKLAAALRT